MNIRILPGSALIGALIFVTNTAVLASTIQTNISGEFVDIATDANTVYRTVNDQVPGRVALAWQDSDCVTCNSARSRIRFDDFGQSARGNNGFTGYGDPFALGLLRFKNLTGPGASGLNGTQLNLSVLLSDTMVEPVDLVFNISLNEVSSVAKNRNRSTSGDQLTITLADTSYAFSTAEGNYQLHILGWSRDGGNTFTDTLRVADNAFAGMRLYGVVTVSQVPVPAAAWLLGSGLLALTGVARRRAA